MSFLACRLTDRCCALRLAQRSFHNSLAQPASNGNCSSGQNPRRFANRFACSASVGFEFDPRLDGIVRGEDRTAQQLLVRETVVDKDTGEGGALGGSRRLALARVTSEK